MTQPIQESKDQTPRQDPLRYGGPVQLVTTPIIWWSGLGFLLVFGVLVWAILGRIPVITNGKGAFSYPFRVQAINLPTSDTDAKVDKIYKTAGSFVSRNENLARLKVPETEYNVEASSEKLKLAESKLKIAKALNIPLITLAEDQSKAYNIQTEAYRRLLIEGYKLREKGVISETTYINTENSYNQSKNSYVEKQDNIQNYKNSIETARQSLREAQIQLDQDLETLEDKTVVKSPFNGFVLDVQYAEGSPVSSKPLMNLLDMSGFKAENIPSNLKTLLRQLETRSDNFERKKEPLSSKANLNNSSIIPLYVLAYFSQDSGKPISVGMEARILPQNVKANTVGTLRGRVVSVYPLPATADSASSILGSSSLANELVKDGSAPRQVLIRLFPDTKYPSGYQWISGKGPSLPSQIPTIGGLVSVNVVVERKPPIVLALPALREAFGLPQGTN
jgi:HlyD family secretion protein